jgi:hypothetical protein
MMPIQPGLHLKKTMSHKDQEGGHKDIQIQYMWLVKYNYELIMTARAGEPSDELERVSS